MQSVRLYLMPPICLASRILSGLMNICVLAVTRTRASISSPWVSGNDLSYPLFFNRESQGCDHDPWRQPNEVYRVRPCGGCLDCPGPKPLRKARETPRKTRCHPFATKSNTHSA